jgi:nicotinamide phosphoribosyltransferase
MKNNKWSAQNIVFGMGGGLHQDMTRDTQRFAFKSSAQCRSGIWHDIHKDPIDASKTSKKGKQYLYLVEGSHGNKWVTSNKELLYDNQLRTVFENGRILIDYTMDEIREGASL